MKKVIIVGAGIAGLTAGVYALQSGFDVTIYESHTIPGGASTSWRRKGYLFEGGIHWMTGSSPKKALNQVWREVGALDDTVKVYNRDPFSAIEYNGQTAYHYRDVEKLREHFLEISPGDEKEIGRFCRDIRKFMKFSMPVTDIKGVKVRNKPAPSPSLFDMLPAMLRLPYYLRHTAGQLSRRFKSPLIRKLLEMTGTDNIAIGTIFTFATLASGDGGYPEGGSLAMAGRIAKRFQESGGRIEYGKMVDKVEVQNGAACGAVVNGELIPADAVIVAQDALVAIDTLFDPPIREPWAERMRQNTKPTLDTFIGLGVRADLSGLPESMTFFPNEPFQCGGITESAISFYQYSDYKGYAPEGCTAVTCFFLGDTYDFWKACKKNGTYEAEKQKLAEALIGILEKKIPQTAGKIDVWDVATPLTYERYLHSYKGSWMTEMGKSKREKDYPSKPDSIKNLYFAGQRLMPPGGLPVAAVTGRTAAQHLCKDTNTVFQGNL
jgi:phytoene dehydrogenase-like protein